MEDKIQTKMNGRGPTSKNKCKDTTIQEKPEDKSAQDMEIIPAFSTTEIQLKIEEIPPLDAFYSPRHKGVMTRSKKKRKMEDSPELPIDATLMQVLWKETQSAPVKELNRLSQLAAAYANATIHKAAEVKSLIIKKDQKIAQMEQVFFDEKQRIEQELQSSINNLQQEFECLQLKLENEIKEKDQIILQLQQRIEKLQERPEINEV